MTEHAQESVNQAHPAIGGSPYCLHDPCPWHLSEETRLRPPNFGPATIMEGEPSLVVVRVAAALAGEGAAVPEPFDNGPQWPGDEGTSFGIGKGSVDQPQVTYGPCFPKCPRGPHYHSHVRGAAVTHTHPYPEGAANQPQRDRFRIGCCYGNCDNSVSGQAGDPIGVLDGWIFDGRTWTCPLHHEGAADQPQPIMRNLDGLPHWPRDPQRRHAPHCVRGCTDEGHAQQAGPHVHADDLRDECWECNPPADRKRPETGAPE